MALTSEQVGNDIREMNRAEKAEKNKTFAVTPKLEAQIKRDAAAFMKKLREPGKDKKKVVETAVKEVLAYALSVEQEPEIFWAHELKAADLIERPYTRQSIRGQLGINWGPLRNTTGNLSSLEYATIDYRKWGGNFSDEIQGILNKYGRQATTYHRRVDRVVNRSKILSGHIYRLRRKAPEVPADQKKEPERDGWGYRRVWSDYFRSMFPVELAERYKAFVASKHFIAGRPIEQLLKNCYTIVTNLYAMYFRENQVILVEKPEVHMIESQRNWDPWLLHNDSGPAVRFPKLGKEIYCLNGVTVPKEIVTTPGDKLDPQTMTQTRNVEVRRELVRKIGIDRIIEALGATTLEKSEDSKYELVNLALDVGNAGVGRARPYLKMLNPSTGTWHFEGVEPGITTIAEALRFRNNTSETPEALT